MLSAKPRREVALKLRIWQVFLLIPLYLGIAIWQYMDIAALERGELASVDVWAPMVAVYSVGGKLGVALVWALPALLLGYVLWRVFGRGDVRS